MWELLRGNWRVWVALLAILILLVMALCWWLWSPTPPVPEVFKPQAVQRDGSVVLEKAPDAEAKHAHAIPKGGKVERVVKVTVQPRPVVQPTEPAVPTATAPTASPEPTTGQTPQEPEEAHVIKCPDPEPVTVELSLVKMPDQTRRVIASSPDGQVVGGVDIPVQDAEPPPAPKLWAAGLVMNPFRRTGGAFVDRDVGFLRLGVQLNQREEGDLPNEGWVKAGVRW
jgi:hypothetical protein